MDSGVFILITLQKLFEAINTDNEDDVYKLIFQLGLHNMYPDDAIKFLIRILIVCHDAEYTNNGVIEILVASCEKTVDDDLSIVAKLFQDQSIDDNALRYTCLRLEHVTFTSLMLEYIKYDRDYNLTLVYKRIHAIFGEQEDKTIYSTLLNDSRVEDNPVVEEFLGRLIGEISAPINKPAWVHNFRSIPDLPYEDGFEDISYVYDFSLPPHDTVVELLMSGIDHNSIDEGEYDELRDEKSKLANQSTVPERMAMIKPFIENKILMDRSEDVRLFRVYGPTNPLMHVNLTLENDPHGGARMLTDNSFNSLDNEFGTIDYQAEWFIGYCEECYQKISKKCYAIRIPLILGGFVGCFCCKQCILKSDTYFDTSKNEPSQVQVVMIDLLEKQLLFFGIQDRLYC